METLEFLEVPIESRESIEFNPSSSSTIFGTSTLITYDEAVDGDLPQSSSDSPVFVLGVGTNTFIGETTFSNNESVDTDFDSFAFSIPAGTSLESISLNISLLPVGSGIFSNTTYSLQDSLFNGISFESVTIPSTDLSLFNADLPLNPGQFAIQQTGLSGALGPGEFRTAAYTFSLEVEGSQPFLIEAEDLDLVNYRVEDNDFASNGELISLRGAGNDTGSASTTFTGSDGLYDIVVGYFDENDGNARFSFEVDGMPVDNWRADQDLGSGAPNEETFTRRTIGGVELETGDELAIIGTADRSDFARVDFLQLLPRSIFDVDLDDGSAAFGGNGNGVAIL